MRDILLLNIGFAVEPFKAKISPCFLLSKRPSDGIPEKGQDTENIWCNFGR